MNKYLSYSFILMALVCLALTVVFGALSAFQYLEHDFLKSYVSFNQMRPLHVTSAVSWIVLSATGGIYYYLEQEGMRLFSPRLKKLHLLLFLFTGIAIYISLLLGFKGGREYLVFPPLLVIPIIIGWMLFAFNYWKTVLRYAKKWPVYYWMWGTGICFMIYHLLEANLWVLDYFRGNYIKDLSVQWKSYGSFVGAWNQLVYGTAIYLMSKIKKDDSIGRGKLSFFFYFLGIANLMFGWAHHTYLVPMPEWIRYLAYGTSMTEWLILFYMLREWKKSFSKNDKTKKTLAYRFLISADNWILANLVLALLISIPALNLFTHGSHITVAHSMATTIGINTSILFASICFIATSKYESHSFNEGRKMKIGLHLFNASLALFLLSLLVMGINKGIWQFNEKVVTFSEFQDGQHFYFIAFAVFGVALGASILYISILFIKQIYRLMINIP